MKWLIFLKLELVRPRDCACPRVHVKYVAAMSVSCHQRGMIGIGLSESKSTRPENWYKVTCDKKYLS